MSLRELNPRTRRRLRLHAWLLTAWCVLAGFATSWLLLHAFGFGTPAARYAIAGVVMYALGLVVGARIWLVHFSQSVAAKPGAFGHAGPGEAEPSAAAKEGRAGRAFDWADLLSGAFDLLSFEEAAVLLLIPAAIVAIGALLLASGTFPMLLLDGVSGLLAEVAVQFVFGALIARRVMRPRHHDTAFMSIVERTWAVGLILVVASAGAGWAVAWLHPGATSVADLWR